MSKDSPMERLDEEQIRAVESPAHHTLVVAGPGSGKTTVLTARYVRHLKAGVPPHRLCAITFTNRAAEHMRQRIASMLDSIPIRSCYIDTFHGLALRLLRANRREFSLIGREETIEILKGLGVKAPKGCAERLSLVKNRVVEPTEQEAELLQLYSLALKERGGLDLDDLLLELCNLLEEQKDMGFSVVMVDEFQDINPLQAHIVGLLTTRGAGLFAIGDPDQSIYGFRGANLEGFLNFTKSYPDADVVTLGRNYRSSKPIVEAATALIVRNARRISHPLRAVGEEGHRIVSARFKDEKEEASFIVSCIEELMGGLSSLGATHTHKDYGFSDFAVLFRTRRQILPFEEVFRASSIPYRVVGVPEGIGELAERLKATGGDISRETVEAIARELGIKDELMGYVGSLLEECRTHRELAERLILMEPSDSLGISVDRVSLLTMHAAKGLEFKVVFVTGCDDGVVPLKDEPLEEERRLFYVAITRAIDRLYLTGAERRRGFGVGLRQSPFLKDIPNRLLQEHRPRQKVRRQYQRGLFD